MRRPIRLIPTVALLLAGACSVQLPPETPPVIVPPVVETPPVQPPAPACASPWAAQQPLIERVYRELLRRAPDDFGRADYGAKLCTGVLDEASFEADVKASPEYAALHTPAPPVSVTWPAMCLGYYASPTDPDLDLEAFGAFHKDVGATCTRGWLLDAWAVGQRGPDGKYLEGQYDGFLPMARLPDGRFDLATRNPRYFEHLAHYVDVMNRYGVWPHLTILDLYTWSDRKAPLPYVPDPNLGPYRNNINGVRWGAPDDRTFGADGSWENNPAQLPDPWLKGFICDVVTTLKGKVYAFEVGNEMPEKDMHFRILGAIRACGFDGAVTVNRNEETPGQYFNMDIGGRFTAVAHHGFADIGYLDEVHPGEIGAGRPSTFRAFWTWPGVAPSRVIVSSDGHGGKPDLQPALREIYRDALARGAGIEHQLALKRRRFGILQGQDKSDRRLDMQDLELDRAFLKEVFAFPKVSRIVVPVGKLLR